ncbi:RND family efflux transporter, MFP subunit [Desulfocicer vacuolatum DSM 3385]|uniref:RND family efflux transporter, MFP subunit n=1 Tax=Desulfocicer vacuolatum DSM 3385 TaxID=1121400 RepID=A0A1W2E4L9_9BACT|nr:efflux RND transporter periplasmic adaptor subunit [Desulfocicer vacuolatum]SMD04709.1 RND family efflux transporter, MFP subunit [Desulfocicer vacuolatum DSM 3385]
MKNKFEKMWPVLCLALGMVWPGYLMAAGEGALLTRVVTAPVIEKNVAETTRVVGTLFFDRVSHLSTEVSGLVNAAHVREGDRVKKGQVMFGLNTDFVDNEIASVQAGMAQIKVRLGRAEKSLKRYETLFNQKAVSEAEYDDIVLSREDLVRQAVILEKQLALARLKKRKSLIRAPFDGVVIEKKADTGDWVSPGGRLCVVGSINDLFVKVPVSEKLLTFARKGEKVPVAIDALGMNDIGTIDGIIPVADPQTRSVFVKVKLPELAHPVLNMSATVSMPVGEKKNMLLIPRDALINFNGQDMVYTVDKGKSVPIPVTILSYVGENVAVGPGKITKGMALVVDGNERLRPGQGVEVVKAPER